MLNCERSVYRENRAIFNNGRQEGKIEDIKNMLKEKFSIETISRITGMSKTEIEKYK